MEDHRISFIHDNTEYTFIKPVRGNLEGYELMLVCRVEVKIYMCEHNLKGAYVLTGMAKV